MLERSPVRFRRKLSEAGYVAAVEADDAELQIAMVVESTPSGTALLGSSRQHVGFDREVEISVAGAIARRAARFFPVLRDARALRVYAGLRPLTPDHVPIIGPFAEAPNICVATGHEGAGIGLAPATGELVAELVHGRAVGDPDRLVLARPLRPGCPRDRADRRRRAAARAGGPERRRGDPGQGRIALRDSPGGAPRGLYCGIGVCQECRVLVDGVAVRSCVTPVAAGMRVTTVHVTTGERRRPEALLTRWSLAWSRARPRRRTTNASPWRPLDNCRIAPPAFRHLPVHSAARRA